MTDKLEFTTILICSVTMTFFALIVIGLCTSCTISMQNVMTSGTASDIVDTNPTTDTNPSLTIPSKVL